MPPYSLVLKNATVVDGTGSERFVADVALTNATIAKVDRACSVRGERELDCSGLILTPGFIDTHSHSDLRLFVDPQLPMKIRQGVTLEILGQDGISVAPIQDKHKTATRRQLAGLLGDPLLDWNWSSVADFLARIEARKTSSDIAYLVPHGAIRQYVVGNENRKAQPHELDAMVQLLKKSMLEGAVGLSSGLIYPPCCYADSEELHALCRAVQEMRGVFVVHIRSESDYILESLDEMIELARDEGVHVHISHFKIAGRTNWAKIDAVLQRVEEARDLGFQITADQYPYVAGSTLFGAILPPWAHDGGTEKTLQLLADATARVKLRAEMLSTERQSWDNFWKWSGPEGIIISDVASSANADLIGKTVAQAADLRGKDPVAFALNLLLEERMGVSMVSFSQDEPVVEKILLKDYVNVCTDGLLGGKPHPRAYGTYPRILGHYVRERKLLSLEAAVHKMTRLAAKTFSLNNYGLVREGCVANLVAFDENTVIDKATFDNPLQFPEGIVRVIVRGVPVVENGQQKEVFPGKVLKRSEEVRL